MGNGKKNINWKGGVIALIGIILLCLFATSCTHTKELHKTDTTIKTDSVVTTVSVTTATETTTGTLEIKGDTLSRVETVQQLIDEPIDIENTDIKLVVSINPKTHKVTAKAIEKAKVVPVKIVKETTNTTTTKADVKRDEEVKTKDLDKKTVGVNWTLIIAIPVTVLTLFLFFIIWRKRKQAKEIIDKVEKIV